MKNVKRWSNNNQIQRWVATSLLQAEKKFRRVRGYKSMGVLVPALELYLIENGIDTMQKVVYFTSQLNIVLCISTENEATSIVT